MNNIQIVDTFTATHFEFLSAYSQVAVIVDENTADLCYPVIKDLLPKHQLIQIHSGEEHKNLDTCQDIWAQFTAHQFDRHAVVLNLGGGVIGDMGGFCAATYKRGIDFVQIPTTLLAQVDASVGGKLGIDFQGFKNHIGLFRIPNLVLIAPVFLQTLSDRELRSGFAEVIKHALIYDRVHWKELRDKKLTEQPWKTIIPHSVGIKDQVVKADPTEKNLRKILNFGHTIGHAVETYFLEQPTKRLLHGEAIGIGMIAEAYLAHQKGFISELDYQEIETYILQVFGKITITEEEIAALLTNALQDKKNENGMILASLLDEVGKANYNQAITLQEIEQALKYYLGRPAVLNG
ncbi:MAG: 3-dehydroquinate synthase [Flammeovirgaceae bacterium]